MYIRLIIVLISMFSFCSYAESKVTLESLAKEIKKIKSAFPIIKEEISRVEKYAKGNGKWIVFNGSSITHIVDYMSCDSNLKVDQDKCGLYKPTYQATCLEKARKTFKVCSNKTDKEEIKQIREVFPNYRKKGKTKKQWFL